MARVTVEDCVEKVPNRFDLVMLASQRSREISAGAQLTLERDNDKNPVVALREIAESTIDRDELADSLISGLQKHVEVDEPEDEDLTEFDALAGEVAVETAASPTAEEAAPVEDEVAE